MYKNIVITGLLAPNFCACFSDECPGVDLFFICCGPLQLQTEPHTAAHLSLMWGAPLAQIALVSAALDGPFIHFLFFYTYFIQLRVTGGLEPAVI